jgi:hypothetical protein
MDECVGGWVDGSIDGPTGGRKDRWMEGCMHW